MKNKLKKNIRSWKAMIHKSRWLLGFIFLICLWNAASELAIRNSHTGWLAGLAMLGTAGILPFFYIIITGNKKN